MKKTLLILLGVLVLAIIGGGYWVATEGEETLRAGIEREAPKIVGAPVGLASLSLSPFSGGASIEDLTIGNPGGYSEAQALSLGGVTVSLQPMSLFSDLIVIDRIAIDRPIIRIEPGAGGATNLQALQRNIEAYIGPAPEEEQPTPLRIAHFDLTGAKLVVGGGPIGFSDRSLTLPDLHLTDLGGEQGILPAEAAKKVFAALMPNIREALASGLGQELLSNARARLGNLEGAAMDKADALLKEQGGKLPEDLREKADEALKSGIGGLLGKKKKKEDDEDGGGL